MKLLRKTLKTVYVRQYVEIKDNEGYVTNGYGNAREIKANIQPMTNKLSIELYGLKANEMLVCYTLDDSMAVNDTMCVNVASTSDPDYKIVSVKRYNTHVVAELERL